jgi:preprotein translocase subunit SecG
MGNIGIGLAVVLFIVISILMMLVVLIQRPQGGGLSGAFGGGGGEGAGQTAFGAKTGDVLTTVTVGIFIAFLGMAIVLNFLVRPGDELPVAADAGSGTATIPAETDDPSGTSGDLSSGTFGGGTSEPSGAGAFPVAEPPKPIAEGADAKFLLAETTQEAKEAIEQGIEEDRQKAEEDGGEEPPAGEPDGSGTP